MLCVICSSGKSRPAVCPPLSSRSVSLTRSLFHFLTHPPPLSSSGNIACGVSVHFSMCLFVYLCLLHNSWIWFVLLNRAMGLFSSWLWRQTHRGREGDWEREEGGVGGRCWHCCILLLCVIKNIRLSINSHMLICIFYMILLFTLSPTVVHIWISTSKHWDIINPSVYGVEDCMQII